MFPVTSRYNDIEVATLEVEDDTIAYLRCRFLPSSPQSRVVLAEHTVTQGDRLDNISARYLADPEQFWRICDANNAMRPDDLTVEIGGDAASFGHHREGKQMLDPLNSSG